MAHTFAIFVRGDTNLTHPIFVGKEAPVGAAMDAPELWFVISFFWVLGS